MAIMAMAIIQFYSLFKSILVNGRRDQLAGPVLFDRRDNGASPVYLVTPGPVYVVHGPVTALELREDSQIKMLAQI